MSKMVSISIKVKNSIVPIQNKMRWHMQGDMTDFKSLNEKYSINCVSELHDIKKVLQRKSDEQLLGMIKLGKTEWLEKRIND